MVTWPIAAKRRALRKGDKDSDFLSAKRTTGLSRSDANEGNFPHGLFDPLQARAGQARESGRSTKQQRCPESQRTFRTAAHRRRQPLLAGLPFLAPLLTEPASSWRAVLLTSFVKKSDSVRNYKVRQEHCFIYCSKTISIYFFF